MSAMLWEVGMGRWEVLVENSYNHVSLYSSLWLRIGKGERKYKHRAKGAGVKEALGDILPLPHPTLQIRKLAFNFQFLSLEVTSEGSGGEGVRLKVLIVYSWLVPQATSPHP